MSSDGADKQVAKWDPGFTRQIANVVGPAIKRYFRAEVRDLESIPAGGWSPGGVQSLRRHVHARRARLRAAFYEQFGFDRPVYTLGHDMIFIGPIGTWLRRLGVIEANRANAAQALRDGAVVLVFPGGDYDSYRPTFTENVIDFNGRKATSGPRSRRECPSCRWCRSARRRHSCSSPAVIPSPEGLGLKRLRAEILPVSVGFPFGLSVFFPPNLPLPSKIVTRMLEPIDVVAEFGEDPDIDAVDAACARGDAGGPRRTCPRAALPCAWLTGHGRQSRTSSDAVAGPADRADAARQVSADGRGDAPRRYDSHRRIRDGCAAMPGPVRR